MCLLEDSEMTYAAGARGPDGPVASRPWMIYIPKASMELRLLTKGCIDDLN